MDEVTPQQYWIRNDEGKRWGPLQASTLELLIPQKLFKGQLQASADGENFVQIGRFPELREVLDTEWWGVDPADVDRLPPPPGLTIQVTDVEQQVAAAAVALDPSSLAPSPGAALDPSALAPDPSPGAVFDPSALAPDAPPPAAFDPSVLAPEPISELELPDQGDLSQTSALRLAFTIAATELTARVEFVGPGGVSVVHYKKGKPEHVDSELTALGEWLVEKGHLAEAQKQQAEAGASNFGGSFTAALFAQGLMDPGTGFQHLAAWASEVYLEILQLCEGSFLVQRDVPPPPDAFPLGSNPYQFLVKAARLITEAEVRERLGPRLEAPAMKTNVAGCKVEDLRLGPAETRLYPLFDGVHSPAQLAQTEGDSGGTLLRLALLLAECRFLSFAGVVEVQPEAAAPAPPPEPAKDWSEQEERAAKMMARVEKGDHFTVLGLKQSCTDEEVKAAFNKRIRIFHPDRVPDAPEALQQDYRTIFDRLTAAYKALDSEAKRKEYLGAKAEEESAQQEAAQWDPFEEMLSQKDYAKARDALNQRIGQDPGDAGAYAYLAWVTVVSAENREAVKPKALELITRAMKFGPECGVAFLNAARIAKAYGDKDSMKQYLARAKALGAKIPSKKKKA
ncbi:MAG: J domain-containing protein [Deltaproteobacteria bacterium]|nr:J domain-containing protein [Deltaproteobacteria bacterium]